MVAVVGGGPCGCCLALLLARRGEQVDFYEQREDACQASGGRSISLAISARGLATCAELGLEGEVRALSLPMRGRLIHCHGSLQEWLYDPKGGRCIRAISRRDLCSIFWRAIAKRSNIHLHRARFNPEEQAHLYEAVFACDGVNSACRDWLVKHDGLHATVIKHPLQYLEVTGTVYYYSPQHLNIWPEPMLIGLPNREGGLSFTLFGEDLSQAQAILDRKAIGNLHPMQPRPLCTVRVNRLHGRNMILLGDAAHAMLPFYGQGMNCALEDCLLLDQLIDQCFSWKEVFAAMQTQRFEDLQAIQQLAAENYQSMNAHGWLVWWEAQLIRYLALPTPYYLVSFTTRPYREALLLSRRLLWMPAIGVTVFLLVAVLVACFFQ